MRSLGRHILLDFSGCARAVIDDADEVRSILLEAARLAKTTVVKDVIHRFSPQGVSGVLVISESHIAVHSWPEFGCASVDFFTCGSDVDLIEAEDYLYKALGAQKVLRRELERSVLP